MTVIEIGFCVVMILGGLGLLGQVICGTIEAINAKKRFTEELTNAPAIVEQLKKIIGKWECTQQYGFPYEKKQADIDARTQMTDILRDVVCKLSLRERLLVDMGLEQRSAVGRINYVKSVLEKIS